MAWPTLILPLVRNAKRSRDSLTGTKRCLTDTSTEHHATSFPKLLSFLNHCSLVRRLLHWKQVRCILYIAMYNQLLVTISTCVAAATIQYPLQADARPLNEMQPLVSSEALEADITFSNLLKRAQQLSRIAYLSFNEYNHPTRVIGSEGKLMLSAFLLQNLTCPCRTCWYY